MSPGRRGACRGRIRRASSYSSYASFSDPDGNGWLLQEIKTRLPGRGFGGDVATLTELLREAEQHHGKYEATAPKHHWSGWYAAYIVARERGQTPEEAAEGRRRATWTAPADEALDAQVAGFISPSTVGISSETVGWMGTARMYASIVARAFIMSITPWIASSPPTPRMAAPRI